MSAIGPIRRDRSHDAAIRPGSEMELLIRVHFATRGYCLASLRDECLHLDFSEVLRVQVRFPVNSAPFEERRAMKSKLIVLLASLAVAAIQCPAVAQTLISPGGFRGGPTVSVPVGGLASPTGVGPTVDLTRPTLTTTLPAIQAPTVQTSPYKGSASPRSDAPRHAVPPSRPSEPGPDGDAEGPAESGPPAVSLPAASGAGQGGEEPRVPPAPSASNPDRYSPWWLVIGIGVAVILIRGATRGRRRR